MRTPWRPGILHSIPPPVWKVCSNKDLQKWHLYRVPNNIFNSFWTILPQGIPKRFGCYKKWFPKDTKIKPAALSWSFTTSTSETFVLAPRLVMGATSINCHSIVVFQSSPLEMTSCRSLYVLVDASVKGLCTLEGVVPVIRTQRHVYRLIDYLLGNCTVPWVMLHSYCNTISKG